MRSETTVTLRRLTSTRRAPRRRARGRSRSTRRQRRPGRRLPGSGPRPSPRRRRRRRTPRRSVPKRIVRVECGAGERGLEEIGGSEVVERPAHLADLGAIGRIGDGREVLVLEAPGKLAQRAAIAELIEQGDEVACDRRPLALARRPYGDLRARGARGGDQTLGLGEVGAGPGPGRIGASVYGQYDS